MTGLLRISPSRFIVTAALALALVGSGVAESTQRTEPGSLVVIDGDTLDYHGTAIDLAGIDAPELGQFCVVDQKSYPCGVQVAFDLKKLLAFESVTCTPGNGEAPGYDCRTKNSSLSVRLAEEGLVVARSNSDIESASRSARAVPLGIWRGEFADPGAWRRGSRLPGEPTDAPCPVLGVQIDGMTRYLVPTDPDYETWLGRDPDVRFCTDEDARAAGYGHVGSAVTPASH
ncbi:MAG: thermonuclease family protein [Pseudomonadales bacterium]